jgi:hypothetical protein
VAEAVAQVSEALKRVFRTQITSHRDLFGYVLRTSGICAAAALAVDIVNQMVFFINWSEALRSWAITIILAFSIAVGCLYRAVRGWRDKRAHLYINEFVSLDSDRDDDPVGYMTAVGVNAAVGLFALAMAIFAAFLR